jgi:hypothetical protein
MQQNLDYYLALPEVDKDKLRNLEEQVRLFELRHIDVVFK